MLKDYFSSYNTYGAFLSLLIVILTGISSAIVHAYPDFSALQLMFVRDATALILLLGITLTRYGIKNTIKLGNLTKISRWHFIRTSIGFTGGILIITALQRMPMAEVVVLSSVGAIFTSLGAKLLFAEQIRATRWMLIALSVVGLWLINYVSVNLSISYNVLLPLIAALCFSATALCVKKIAKHNNSKTSLFYFICISFMLSAPFGFNLPSLPFIDYLPLIFLGGVYILTQLLLIESYSYAELSFIAPFKLSKYPVNVLLGLLIFDEWPANNILMGAGLIIFASLAMLKTDNTKKLSK